jgi:hypothetical protein
MRDLIHEIWREWLLFNANSAIFQLCHGENKFILNEMMMSFFFWPLCCLFFFDIQLYGFWLPLWYPQTLLLNQHNIVCSKFYKLYKYNINISHNKKSSYKPGDKSWTRKFSTWFSLMRHLIHAIWREWLLFNANSAIFQLYHGPPIFSGVRVTRSLVLYLWFVDHCLSFCTFFLFDHIMARTSLFSMRWWWGPLCSKPTRWVGFSYW